MAEKADSLDVRPLAGLIAATDTAMAPWRASGWSIELTRNDCAMRVYIGPHDEAPAAVVQVDLPNGSRISLASGGTDLHGHWLCVLSRFLCHGTALPVGADMARLPVVAVAPLVAAARTEASLDLVLAERTIYGEDRFGGVPVAMRHLHAEILRLVGAQLRLAA